MAPLTITMEFFRNSTIWANSVASLTQFLLYLLHLLGEIMKKAVAIAALAFASFSAFAGETITFTNIYSVGGGTDKAFSSLIPSLERQGFTVKKNFTKSCVDGMQVLAATPQNHILGVSTGDIAFSDHTKNGMRCPSLNTAPAKFELFSSLNGGPVYLCTSPKFEGTSVERLRAFAQVGRKVKIGYTSKIHKEIVDQMIHSQLPTLNYVMLMYSGGGQNRTAALAGDVDFVVGSSVAAELVPYGSTCIAGSERKDPTVPFFGELEKGKPVKGFAEFLNHNLLVSVNSSITPTVAKALKTAMQSPEFKEAVAQIGSKHVGIGDGISAAETVKTVSAVERNYIFTGK